MRVYELRSNPEDYRWLTLVHEADFDVLDALADAPIGAAWKPLAVEWLEDDLSAGKAKSDFPTLGTTPAFSQRAVDSLRDLLVDNGELLPLALAGAMDGEYYAYNVTRQIDALDEDRSEFVRFSRGPGIMRVTRFELHRDRLDGAAIFRLPQLRGAEFVTEPFVSRVREAGLTGFDFHEVWRADGEQG